MSDVNKIRIGDLVYNLNDEDLQSKLQQVINKVTSQSQANASYHLGFYVDANGDLCQVQEGE